MPRSKRSQTKHDSTIRKIAKEYKEKGYKVEADLKRMGRPAAIEGLRPDIWVRKRGHETIIEVETPDSIDSRRDLQQQKAFKSWSQGSRTRHYRRVIT